MQANLQLSDAIHPLEERSVTLPLARQAGLNAALHARAQGSVNFIVGCLSHVNGEVWLLSFVVGSQVCLATLCSNPGRLGTTGSVQEDGQRVHTYRHSQRRILVENALTTLLQPAGPV